MSIKMKIICKGSRRFTVEYGSATVNAENHCEANDPIHPFVSKQLILSNGVKAVCC